MKNKLFKTRYVIGMDPSGNFTEGKGTTGWCVYDRFEDEFIMCNTIQASKFETQLDYWQAHIDLLVYLQELFDIDGVVLSAESYILYSNKSKAQKNSEMETCQLIGVLKIVSKSLGLPLYLRNAVHVKKRWADEILINKEYLTKNKEHFNVECRKGVLTEHERDSMRHALHCAHFELDKEEIK